MGHDIEPSDTQHPSGTAPNRLKQVTPDYGSEFVSRPISLLLDELGDLPVTRAKAPTHVLAWVRYPAIAHQVPGLALAWTQRAVYVEWEDRGTHRAWVWASAVERAPATSPSSAMPERPAERVVTALNALPLVELVNVQLAQLGAEFRTSLAKPMGPFSAVVFGSIEDHAVRLELFTEPTTDMCAVQLFDMSAKKVLAERVAASTFDESIELYPWVDAIDALTLVDDPEP